MKKILVINGTRDQEPKIAEVLKARYDDKYDGAKLEFTCWSDHPTRYWIKCFKKCKYELLLFVNLDSFKFPCDLRHKAYSAPCIFLKDGLVETADYNLEPPFLDGYGEWENNYFDMLEELLRLTINEKAKKNGGGLKERTLYKLKQVWDTASARKAYIAYTQYRIDAMSECYGPDDTKEQVQSDVDYCNRLYFPDELKGAKKLRYNPKWLKSYPD